VTALLPIIAWSKVGVDNRGVPYHVDNPTGDFMTCTNSAGHTVMRGDAIVTHNILEERARPYAEDPHSRWWILAQRLPGSPAKGWMIWGEVGVTAKGGKKPNGNDGEAGEEHDGDEYDGEDGEQCDGEDGEEEYEMDEE